MLENEVINDSESSTDGSLKIVIETIEDKRKKKLDMINSHKRHVKQLKKLDDDFFKQIIEAENIYYSKPSTKNCKKLLTLYQLGTEFYCKKGNKAFEYFLMKIKNIMAADSMFKIMLNKDKSKRRLNFHKITQQLSSIDNLNLSEAAKKIIEKSEKEHEVLSEKLKESIKKQRKNFRHLIQKKIMKNRIDQTIKINEEIESLNDSPSEENMESLTENKEPIVDLESNINISRPRKYKSIAIKSKARPRKYSISFNKLSDSFSSITENREVHTRKRKNTIIDLNKSLKLFSFIRKNSDSQEILHQSINKLISVNDKGKSEEKNGGLETNRNASDSSLSSVNNFTKELLKNKGKNSECRHKNNEVVDILLDFLKEYSNKLYYLFQGSKNEAINELLSLIEDSYETKVKKFDDFNEKLCKYMEYASDNEGQEDMNDDEKQLDETLNKIIEEYKENYIKEINTIDVENMRKLHEFYLGKKSEKLNKDIAIGNLNTDTLVQIEQIFE